MSFDPWIYYIMSRYYYEIKDNVRKYLNYQVLFLGVYYTYLFKLVESSFIIFYTRGCLLSKLGSGNRRREEVINYVILHELCVIPKGYFDYKGYIYGKYSHTAFKDSWLKRLMNISLIKMKHLKCGFTGEFSDYRRQLA